VEGDCGWGSAVNIEKQVVVRCEGWENDTEALVLINPFQYP
jgi:hypothetical protein